MYTYSQSTGRITANGTWEGSGYSGHGIGLNNGALEAEVGLGPIPKGRWRIVSWTPGETHYIDHNGHDLGPIVAILEPVGHDAHGRTGFRIHGDNEAMNHTASDGCIVDPRNVRQNWRASKDLDLEVIA